MNNLPHDGKNETVCHECQELVPIEFMIGTSLCPDCTFDYRVATPDYQQEDTDG